jgi:fumarylacetoacetate (FAA) hydrolase
MPPSFWTDPLMYQGGSDGFIGPCDPIPRPTKPGASISKPKSRHHRRCADGRRRAHAAERHIKLLMLVNDVSCAI